MAMISRTTSVLALAGIAPAVIGSGGQAVVEGTGTGGDTEGYSDVNRTEQGRDPEFEGLAPVTFPSAEQEAELPSPEGAGVVEFSGPLPAGVQAELDAGEPRDNSFFSPERTDELPFFDAGTGTAGVEPMQFCEGIYYQARGTSIYPPNDGTMIVRGNPGLYEVRRILGLECLDDNRNWFVDPDFVKAHSEPIEYVDDMIGNISDYGNRVITEDGESFEGCWWSFNSEAIHPWVCDFYASDWGPHELVTDTTSNYAWRVFRDWGSYQLTVTAPCVVAIIETWESIAQVGTATTACLGAGPYENPESWD